MNEIANLNQLTPFISLKLAGPVERRLYALALLIHLSEFKIDDNVS